MIYFVSDIHLGFHLREQDKKRENNFIDFLENIRTDCKELFLLGDIFDYWFEYKTVVPAPFYRTLTKISELISDGIKIEYLMGNHDFGHKDFFKNEFGIDIIKTDIERTFNGKRFYLSHGDGKAYNDKPYLMLRAILRNRVCQKIYSFLHPDCGISMALGTSRKSRKYTDNKNYGAKDGLKDFAEKKISEGFDFVIMGHRHLAETVRFSKGIYINLGEWFQNPHYAKFDGENLELIPYNAKS